MGSSLSNYKVLYTYLNSGLYLDEKEKKYYYKSLGSSIQEVRVLVQTGEKEFIEAKIIKTSKGNNWLEFAPSRSLSYFLDITQYTIILEGITFIKYVLYARFDTEY